MNVGMDTRRDTQTHSDTLTVREVHERLGRSRIARGSLYRAIGRGDLPSVRLGKRILVPVDAFRDWLQCRSAT